MHNTLLQHNILLQFENKNKKEMTSKHVNIPCDILKIIMEKKLVILKQHIIQEAIMFVAAKVKME